jgi:hypothetical protein
MTTVARWKAALQRIADGEDYPDLIAKEALRSRKPPPSTKPKPIPYEKTEQRRAERREKILRIYEDWWDSGRPSQRVWAKKHGVAVSTIGNWLWMGGHMICHMKNHRLHKQVYPWIYGK